ncbi:FixH family protein [Muriicola sp. Z0-33]|uniref:FixH family protein n=1 Tax=Muriicola sp. Z0-33 TaxID=2816957 RepID=UPI002238ED4A|nr:FixH family protein [Muriicola sp. Z0-33]MCW5517190.1 FixH family protein [Muriicola sp. Z0-33]
MKINWGTAIVMAFAAFIAFILYFVFIASTDNRAEHDLVTEDYYKEELAYQKEINAQTNASKLSTPIKIIKGEEGLIIYIPEEFNTQNTKGTVSLYRPSNKQLDFDLPLSWSKSHLLIPDKRLLDGRWDIKIYWVYKEKAYLHKESIVY